MLRGLYFWLRTDHCRECGEVRGDGDGDAVDGVGTGVLGRGEGGE